MQTFIFQNTYGESKTDISKLYIIVYRLFIDYLSPFMFHKLFIV